MTTNWPERMSKGSRFSTAIRQPEHQRNLVRKGGYGTVRIIDLLDFKFKQSPKWIIGFSDITVLQPFEYHGI
jgi:muramoyltetrapeptide carboxypeptidase